MSTGVKDFRQTATRVSTPRSKPFLRETMADILFARVQRLIRDSEFLNGPHMDAVRNSVQLEQMTADTDISEVDLWDLQFKYPEGDTRHGMDHWWDDYDPRINSIYGYRQRAMMAERPDLVQSEHIVFPGNVVVVKDEADALFLLFITWAGFSHTPGTALRNTFAIEGIYINGTSTEMYFPNVHHSEIGPFFVTMDANMSELALVAFASRAILDTEEIMEVIRPLPARDPQSNKPVLTKSLRLKDLQFGMTMSLCCHLHYMF
jgi:hypothetical protein